MTSKGTFENMAETKLHIPNSSCCFFYERVPFDDLQVNRCIRHRQINLHTIVSYVHVVLQQHHEHI